MTDILIPIEHRLVITEEVARRCARAAGRSIVFRPGILVPSSLVLVALILVGCADAVLRESVVLLPLFLLAGIGVAAAFPALLYAVATRSVRRQCHVGAEWGTGFGPDSMRVDTPLTKGTLAYSNFDRLIPGNDAVLLRYKTSRMVVALPAALMPVEAQNRIALHLSR